LKNIFIIFLLVSNLLASSLEIEQKIYTVVLFTIFPHKSTINIWSDDERNRKLLSSLSLDIKIVENIQDADLLLITHTYNIQTDKMVFVGKYSLLKEYNKSAIGGFYWQKGRPNLVFLHKNILLYHINLPNDMKEFEEDEL